MEVVHDEMVLIAMVGLPARGKSYIARKIINYLNWRGINATIFNVGKYRRETTADNQDHQFFNAGNAECNEIRDQMAMHVLDEAFTYLECNGRVAIFDATNTTNARRDKVLDRAHQRNPKLNVIFLESVCDDPEVIDRNLRAKIEHSPDFKGMLKEEAMTDLRARVANYEQVYETLSDDSESYIKLINLQSKVICNRIYGTIPHHLVSFLMGIHLRNRPIYLIRPGHVPRVTQLEKAQIKALDSVRTRTNSQATAEGLRLQGEYASSTSLMTTSNCNLDAAGELFAKKLAKYFQDELGHEYRKLKVFTSTLPRSLDTVAQLEIDYFPLSALNNLDTGICHGMTIPEIKKRMPQEWQDFQNNRFSYRFPGGESICDLVQRMNSFVIDLERQRGPVVVVTHLTTMQVLYGYLFGLNLQESFNVNIPDHTVIKLTPQGARFHEDRIDMSSDINQELHP